jgi:hypothetical protein
MARNLKPPGDSPGGTRSAQILRRLRDLKSRAREQFESGRDATAAAERIIDEMARRQGQRLAPCFDWSLATRDFERRIGASLARKPSAQSMEEFVREFVDAWPRGMTALRVVADGSPITNPPYSQDGMWPAYLDERK